MSRKKSIYLPEEAEATLGPRDEMSLSGRIAGILLRYDSAWRTHCPALSEAEWSAICDALNGTHLAIDGAAPDMSRFLWAEMSDSPEMGEKWGIDVKALALRMQAWSRIEQIACFEVAARFWTSPNLNALSTRELLIEAGARLLPAQPRRNAVI